MALAASLLIVILIGTVQCSDEVKCEVCVKFLTNVAKSMPTDIAKDVAKVEKYVKEKCASAKTKENRFCYYIGALPESASYILNEVVKPLTWQMPAEKICSRLKEKDGQICDLKYDKPIDWKKIDLNKMKVKELKKILDDWGEACKACSEKGDYIARINELKPIYVHEEL